MLPTRDELDIARRRAMQHLANQYAGVGSPSRGNSFAPPRHIESNSSRQLHARQNMVGNARLNGPHQQDSPANPIMPPHAPIGIPLPHHPPIGNPGGSRVPQFFGDGAGAWHPGQGGGNGLPVVSEGAPPSLPVVGERAPGQLPSPQLGPEGLIHLGQGLFLHPETGEIHGFGPISPESGIGLPRLPVNPVASATQGLPTHPMLPFNLSR